MPLDLMQVELTAGPSEVFQRGSVRSQGLRLLREFRFFKKLGDCGCDRRVAITRFWHDGHAVIEGVEFSFLALATSCGVLCVLTDGQSNPPAFFAPLQVV